MSVFRFHNSLILFALLAGLLSSNVVAADNADASAEGTEEEEVFEPWDFSPYRVLVWVVSDDDKVNSTTLGKPLRVYLDRDFAPIWRITMADAPAPVKTGARRDMASLSYDAMVASDPVLAVKRNHKDAIRIRIPSNVAQFCQKIYSTSNAINDLTRRGAEIGNDNLDGVASKLEAIKGDALNLTTIWADEKTEAVLVPRGVAMTLSEPEAKTISPRVGGLISETIDKFDKIFVVKIKKNSIPYEVSVVEVETLMRVVGAVVTEHFVSADDVAVATGRALTRAFSPVVRIDEAGQKTAAGLVRAGGLILKENSPAGVYENDVLMPMVRKNDRNGKPIMIGPLDWAFLVTEKSELPRVEMGFYSGRTGGLQGRQNKRTFRIALKVKPVGETTLVRLHAKGAPNSPLIGYEFYQKELKSKKMTFIGRSDWDGRLRVEKTDDPLRLLYVKNGGAVLARLPVVPGLTEFETADLTGDDMRLHAEAYIRGVENAIVDLVALRKLLSARVRLRLYKGEMEKATELVQLLRDQPTNERLANDMGKKQTMYLRILGSRNANQKRKIDDMFTKTREMLSKMITPREIRELEDDLVKAKKNGGRLDPPTEDPEADDPSANDVTAPPPS